MAAIDVVVLLVGGYDKHQWTALLHQQILTKIRATTTTRTTTMRPSWSLEHKFSRALRHKFNFSVGHCLVVFYFVAARAGVGFH